MLKLRTILLNSKAAIDLASIMVGIIVIGLVGGVIAATVFAVIPWAQDNAAKQQLESIHTAQNAAYGFSADPSRELPAGQKRNSFTNSVGLNSGYGLLAESNTYCTVNNGADDYYAYAKSSSGTIFVSTNKKKEAQPLVGSPAVGCTWLGSGTPTEEENPTVPGTPEVPAEPEGPQTVTYADTRFLVNCPATQTELKLPIQSSSGEVRVVRTSDNVEVAKHSGYSRSASIPVNMPSTFQANTEYEVIFTGTFDKLSNLSSNNSAAQSACYRGMTAWATEAGTKDAGQAFWNMPNLTRVPESIPATVTSATQMFANATSFNQNLSNWDVSNVTGINRMFENARSFSGSLEGWIFNNVTNAREMFKGLTGDNDINMSNWTVNGGNWHGFFGDNDDFAPNATGWKVTDATMVSFFHESVSGQNTRMMNPQMDISNWEVSGGNYETFFKDVVSDGNINTGTIKMDGWKLSNNPKLGSMFKNSNFNGSLNNWDVSGLNGPSGLAGLFQDATSFNQPLDKWDTSNIIEMSGLFKGASSFNQNINAWDVSNVKGFGFGSMFEGARMFNQPLGTWDVSKGTYFGNMFKDASRFNQPLDTWSTRTSSATNMSGMFQNATVYSQNLSGWDVAKVTASGKQNFGTNSKLSAAQLPKFK